MAARRQEENSRRTRNRELLQEFLKTRRALHASRKQARRPSLPRAAGRLHPARNLQPAASSNPGPRLDSRRRKERRKKILQFLQKRKEEREKLLALARQRKAEARARKESLRRTRTEEKQARLRALKEKETARKLAYLKEKQRQSEEALLQRKIAEEHKQAQFKKKTEILQARQAASEAKRKAALQEKEKARQAKQAALQARAQEILRKKEQILQARRARVQVPRPQIKQAAGRRGQNKQRLVDFLATFQVERRKLREERTLAAASLVARRVEEQARRRALKEEKAAARLALAQAHRRRIEEKKQIVLRKREERLAAGKAASEAKKQAAAEERRQAALRREEAARQARQAAEEKRKLRARPKEAPVFLDKRRAENKQRLIGFLAGLQVERRKLREERTLAAASLVARRVEEQARRRALKEEKAAARLALAQAAAEKKQKQLAERLQANARKESLRAEEQARVKLQARLTALEQRQDRIRKKEQIIRALRVLREQNRLAPSLARQRRLEEEKRLAAAAANRTELLARKKQRQQFQEQISRISRPVQEQEAAARQSLQGSQKVYDALRGLLAKAKAIRPAAPPARKLPVPVVPREKPARPAVKYREVFQLGAFLRRNAFRFIFFILLVVWIGEIGFLSLRWKSGQELFEEIVGEKMYEPEKEKKKEEVAERKPVEITFKTEKIDIEGRRDPFSSGALTMETIKRPSPTQIALVKKPDIISILKTPGIVVTPAEERIPTPARASRVPSITRPEETEPTVAASTRLTTERLVSLPEEARPVVSPLVIPEKRPSFVYRGRMIMEGVEYHFLESERRTYRVTLGDEIEGYRLFKKEADKLYLSKDGLIYELGAK